MTSQFFSRISTSPVLRLSVLLMTAIIASTALMPVSSASAGDRHRRNNVGAAIAAGVVGLAVGSLLADSNRRRYDRVQRYEPRYVAPPRPLYEEEVVIYDREPRPRPYFKREPRPVYHEREPRRRHYKREPRPDYQRHQRPRRHQQTRKHHRKPDYVQRQKIENLDAPKVITYNETASLEPWSDGWKSYCSNKFRSFNSKSGTYLGNDGDRHFCVAR